MMTQKIERADYLPAVLYRLMQMKVDEIIDNIYKPHTNRNGLSYGQLSVLFVTYVIHSLNHRLSGMEEWLINHKTVIEQVTVRKLNDKDATDDRPGSLTEVPGEDDEKMLNFRCVWDNRSLPLMNFRPISADMIRRVSMCIISMLKTMIRVYRSPVTAGITAPIFFITDRARDN